MILKFSCLNAKGNLVKYRKKNRYGIFDRDIMEVVLPAEFDFVSMQDGAVIALKGGVYYEIDLKKYTYAIFRTFIPNMFFFKNDRCPGCAGTGCASCFGFGFIASPYNGYPID